MRIPAARTQLFSTTLHAGQQRSRRSPPQPPPPGCAAAGMLPAPPCCAQPGGGTPPLLPTPLPPAALSSASAHQSAARGGRGGVTRLWRWCRLKLRRNADEHSRAEAAAGSCSQRGVPRCGMLPFRQARPVAATLALRRDVLGVTWPMRSSSSAAALSAASCRAVRSMPSRWRSAANTLGMAAAAPGQRQPPMSARPAAATRLRVLALAATAALQEAAEPPAACRGDRCQ